ncbi:MarR family winged helix-turn-helix transcriptional regulator [Erythrobacter rubeus]|uniref:Winged helix-turn-helix transcriptional regulator n=1 Tax=Erythrobacter rubeus TaxID=2760803 RepID=A0ABR8KLS5_9SPHN|nr:MarR family winged helix-turn-helix transcriptional regulator [Erythrobacter rubeus]MBD2841360.1 winged helix-turn-helix transcriptional regulator [Erythrobacter rubeus]
MISNPQLGLGTKLRLLLARLDGELAALYAKGGHNFRPRFYPVFQLLLQCEESSVSEIANYLQATQPAATQTLSEMKKLDLVEFAAGKDRRERIVTLTPHALEMAGDLRPLWDAVGRAANELDEELSHPLSAILDEALAALARKSFPDRISENRASGRKQ